MNELNNLLKYCRFRHEVYNYCLSVLLSLRLTVVSLKGKGQHI